MSAAQYELRHTSKQKRNALKCWGLYRISKNVHCKEKSFRWFRTVLLFCCSVLSSASHCMRHFKQSSRRWCGLFPLMTTLWSTARRSPLSGSGTYGIFFKAHSDDSFGINGNYDIGRGRILDTVSCCEHVLHSSWRVFSKLYQICCSNSKIVLVL